MPTVTTFIAHYADANYNPQKAHEYYLKNRELQGRQPKKVYRYSDTQRKEGNAYLSDQNKQASDKLNSEIEALVKKAQATRARIMKKIETSLASATELELRSVSLQLKTEISKVRDKYAAARKNLASQREQLNS